MADATGDVVAAPQPMLLSDIRDQRSAVETLDAALSGDRLAHAYLFVGPSGVGKEKAAIALACARNCETAPGIGCRSCGVCARIWAGSHPDVRIFHPREDGDRNLKVDYIREEILPFTQFAPFEAKTAFLIFPQADISLPTQHAEAANALLKTLEEPRAGIVFVLLSERPDRLLSTIRSRSQRVRFGPLPRATLISILDANGAPQAQRDTAAALAMGRADRALDLVQDDRAEHLLDWALRLDEAVDARRPGALLDLAEELARSSDRDLVLETLSLFYRDVAAAALGNDDTLLFAHRRDAVDVRAERMTANDAAERFAAIQGAFTSLERNANAEVTLDALLFGLSR